MLKTHEKFYSVNGKRLVLIVDDEMINRELLGMVLREDYETLFAASGDEALGLIREHSETLSLVLLDLLMPGMHGLDLLRLLKNDQTLKDIPVIVLTADQEAEVESLRLGAADFIPKPYPKPEVIIARVVRAIELSEDRDIILSTERDELTGLYNREYFYRYAEQFDQHHRGMDMDAIVVDVYHFRMIVERYGRAYGDQVLCRIGERVRDMVRDNGGIVCRREADTFLVYCPHREDYQAIIENASVGLAGTDAASNRVRLRMGVYAHVDKSIEIERRFDRAKMAADSMRNTLARNIALYDNELHELEIHDEQLLEDFQAAIDERQFVVYYQPKFDIRSETPMLSSCEALVYWQHPEFGRVSPGEFVPLLEDNGLIQALDLYVWRTAAAQVRDWQQRFGIPTPVSVNVSRVDMYDSGLDDTFCAILDEFGLEPASLLLEITEPAYTEDSEQIIKMANKLRDLGFCIEMDDFGTGYSSLNMISSLPIDVLKLDMDFVRDAFRSGRDMRLIEVIIDIADYLSVPVIAEGVETEEQLHALRAIGCDIVQGYYFSRPVPAEEFERFIREKLRQLAGDDETLAATDDGESRHKNLTFARVAQALATDYIAIYCVDTETEEFIEFSAREDFEALGIEQSGGDFFGASRRNVLRVVHPDDQQMVLSVLDKDHLQSDIERAGVSRAVYRLLLDGSPSYVSMKATFMTGKDHHHIVIGVSDIDEQVRGGRVAGVAR